MRIWTVYVNLMSFLMDGIGTVCVWGGLGGTAKPKRISCNSFLINDLIFAEPALIF